MKYLPWKLQVIEESIEEARNYKLTKHFSETGKIKWTKKQIVEKLKKEMNDGDIRRKM